MSDTGEKDRRQQLLDTLGAIIGELFADGLNESAEAVKRSVLHGLEKNRVRISVRIVVPPLEVSFAVVDQDGTDSVTLFEIGDEKARPLRVDQLPPGATESIN